MERVTIKGKDGHYYMTGDGIFSDWSVPERFKGEDVDVVGKLEDILGDDYDIDRLRELIEADRDGRCVVNHLKEGDEVYIMLLGQVFLFEVTSAVWYRSSPIYKAMHGIHLCYVFNHDDIGKTVFLTREEAEAALRRMQDG